MAVIASQFRSASRPISFAHGTKKLFSSLDDVALVLLPSILALLLSAASVGHGEISFQSLLKVLNAMGEINTWTIAAP
jgi:hypothetical protein